MVSSFECLISIYYICFALAYVPPPYVYQTKYYNDMAVDHFSYSDDNMTFDLRYLVNDTFWDKNGGPIFFYCGNEGAVELFAENTGFMWDLAPDFKAMLVFAEHRYYGQTLPYGNLSYAMPYLGKLSSEQALADYAVLLTWLKANTPGAQNSPVVAFGGSYGGMLSAWMRIKYPHVVVGSIASAAPILQFTGLRPCWTFYAVVTQDFHDGATGCDAAIKKSWPLFRQKAKTEEGRAWLNENFNLCEYSKLKKEQDINNLINWLMDGWMGLAVVDYPYPTQLLEPVPGWPVKEACKRITQTKANDDDSLLLDIYNGISVFHNTSGQKQCYSLNDTFAGATGRDGWMFQLCTELIMPICSNGTDMFEVIPWNFTLFADYCRWRYGVRSRIDWAVTNYGGDKLNYASNIVFSNGVLDPAIGGGVVESISDTVVAIVIKEAAHHYDLRGAHPNDTAAVLEARQQEIGHIRKWINEHAKLVKNHGQKVSFYKIV